MAIFALIITFILVVGLHELGHALAALLFNVKIKRISLGLGTPLAIWRYNGCEWVWAKWPLGGYVQLLNTRIETVDPDDFSRSFDKQSLGVRFFILIAGALANLFVTFIAFFLFSTIGYQQQLPVIESITPNSIAAKAGLKSTDQIVSVGGQPTHSWQAVGMQVIMHMGEASLPLQTTSQSTLYLDLTQSLIAKSKALLPALGITPSTAKQTLMNYAGLSWTRACVASFDMTVQWLIFFLIMIKQLLIGAIPFSLLLGPFSMLVVTINSFSQGLVMYLYFLGTLSIAVGSVNLLPIPSLDGGSICYALLEKIRRKPVSIDFEVLMHRLAVIFFSVIFVQLILNDMVRYFIVNSG